MMFGHRLVASLAAGVIAVMLPSSADAVEPKAVTFPGPAGLTLQGSLYQPPTQAVRPAIIALHGCGGNFRADGKRLSARVPDWSERLVAAGYTVLWPDSFGSRGLGPQCGVADRTINPAMRAGDVTAAAAWLASQPTIDKARLALIGWSNGGSTVLHVVATTPVPPIKLAIAFYPGCRPLAARANPAWSTRVPLTILMGGADDWTPPEPCRDLGGGANVRYVEYPNAYHDFDAPDLPVRVRTGLTFTANKSGQAHIGTNPAARAAAIAEVMTLLAAALK